MDIIAQLKTKHIKTNTSLVKDLLQSQTAVLNEARKSQNQQSNENESKIKDLMSKLATMKETLNTETLKLECKNNDLSKHNDYLKELETEKKKLLQEVKRLEGECNNLKSAKPNLQDQLVLEKGKKKLDLYKYLTRIQWDYEATKHSIKGYVSNKCDYIHHFCYENQEINEQLIDSLWHEIYLSSDQAAIRSENPQLDIPTDTNIILK